MKRISFYLLFIIISTSFFSSCIPQKKIEYLRGQTENVKTFNELNYVEEVIKPHDDLYIKVSSFDDIQYNFFSSQSDNNSLNYSNEISLSLISYTVNDSGYIYFPILGNVNVRDMTILQATELLTQQLQEYFSNPTVIIKFINKKVSVIGEVSSPGHFLYTKDHINILEAISMAGDITEFGDLQNVYIIREENNVVSKYHIDLTNDEVLNSQEFFVMKDDVIYISPLKSRNWNTSSIPWDILLSSITTFILILNYTSNN